MGVEKRKTAPQDPRKCGGDMTAMNGRHAGSAKKFEQPKDLRNGRDHGGLTSMNVSFLP